MSILTFIKPVLLISKKETVHQQLEKYVDGSLLFLNDTAWKHLRVKSVPNDFPFSISNLNNSMQLVEQLCGIPS